MRIGILGAGQLGQMLALAGYPLGNRFVFHDLSGSPSAEIGETLVDTAQERLEDFLARVDVVTYEFEHLPVTLVERLAQDKPVFPSAQALAVCQNRAEEKALFTRLGIPTPEYRLVNSAAALEVAARELGGRSGKPVVAKSITEGYDGKGQAVLRHPDDAADAWASIGHRQLIVEAFVEFVREVSIIAVRDQHGEVVFYPMAENQHVDGILRYSLAPMPDLDAQVQATAEGYIKTLLDELDYVGVLTLELFQTGDGLLLANEMAPRVHNSGHWTMNGAVTSQFENHLRAIQGLPLGRTEARHPTCMINLIGQQGKRESLLSEPDSHLHLYGKSERPGRKLGHVNIVAPDHTTLLARVKATAAQVPEAPPVKFSFDPDA